MESFKHKKKEIVFWSYTGKILSQNKYSENHISTSGGGTYIDKHGGYVAPTQVNSTSITQHEFWIKLQDGSEKSVQLSGHDIPLREGQNISLICASLKGQDSGEYSVLVNHNAKRHWYLKDANALNNLFSLDSHIGVWSAFFLVVALGFALFMGIGTGDGIVAFSIIASIFASLPLYMVVRRWRRANKMESALNLHLESLAQAAYQNA